MIFILHYTKDCLSAKSFSISNYNIRRVSTNFDILVHFLSELHFHLLLIIITGLTEIRTKVDKELIFNINIPRYLYHNLITPMLKE